jgi:3-oxoacyl-[acyl-carrier protein] reductase
MAGRHWLPAHHEELARPLPCCWRSRALMLPSISAVRDHGRKRSRPRSTHSVVAQADLTDESGVNTMVGAITRTFGQLHVLVLNASGGLERDKPASYAMELNLTAQVRTLEAALPLMPAGGCVIFVTSHLAHFYGRKPVYAAYEAIAASKKAGEDALRSRIAQFEARDLRLAIVSGDMIDGTITPKLLERTQRGLIESRRDQAGVLPTVQEFAAAIVDAAADASRPNGHVTFVGTTD